jgi:DnaJ-class molecular chaperone
MKRLICLDFIIVEKVRMDMGKIFNPEKYGMVFCPNCKGKGRLLKKPHGFVVCEKCGGFGMVKKKKETFEEDGE